MVTAGVRSKKALRSIIHLLGMSILSFAIGFLMSYDEAVQSSSIGIEIGNHGDGTLSEMSASDGADHIIPPTTLELLGTLLVKQKQLYNQLHEYGRFKSVFGAESLERIFGLSPLSKKRLERKLMIKILLARINSIRGDSSGDPPVFHWVTAGDSAASGIGNSWDLSYTSILQGTVQDIFLSTAGIKFVATNHAGDAWSGMELALCMESIFGRDVDVLSWDFNLVPTKYETNYWDPLSPSQGLDPLLFGERAGQVLPHLPFLFFIGLFSDSDTWERISKLETSGMGIDIMGGEQLIELILTFPNYNNPEGRNGPHAVNGFHCGGLVEGKEMCNEPSQLFWCTPKEGAECANVKYQAGESCGYTDRYQTSWNDGWKMHRLKGRLLGYHMVEMLHQATIELDILERQHPQFRINPSAALEALIEEEEVEEFLFSKNRPSKLYSEGSLDTWDILKQKDAICMNAKAASNFPKSDNMPKFVFDPPHADLCEDFLPFQHAYFRISEEDGWVSIDPLVESHQMISEKTIASVGLCFKHCYGYQCGEHGYEIDGAPIELDQVEVRINGNIVSGFERVGGCVLVPNDKTVQSSSGGIDIRNHGDGTLSLSSSFILYGI
ncbi:hypothetical protein ACHAXR_003337 [Thalassiosira sp. AJA248-18]